MLSTDMHFKSHKGDGYFLFKDDILVNFAIRIGKLQFIEGLRECQTLAGIFWELFLFLPVNYYWGVFYSFQKPLLGNIDE